MDDNGYKIDRTWISPDEYANWKINAEGLTMGQAAPYGLTITLINGLLVDCYIQTHEDFKAENQGLLRAVNRNNN